MHGRSHFGRTRTSSRNLLHSSGSLEFGLIETARLYVRGLQRRTGGLALHATACRALVTLADSEGVTQRRLAQLLKIHPVALGRTLDRLEANGWTERRPKPGDRRAKALGITQKGKALLPLVRQAINESHSAAFEGLSDYEAKLKRWRRKHCNGFCIT